MKTDRKANVWKGIGQTWYVNASWWESPPPEPLTAERPVYRGSAMQLGAFTTVEDADAAAEAFRLDLPMPCAAGLPSPPPEGN